MEILALLSSSEDTVVTGVKRVLGKYTVYPLKTMEELDDLYSNIPLNLLLIDTLSHKLSGLKDFLSGLEDDMVVLITPEKLDKFTAEEMPRSIYDSIDTASIETHLPNMVERALKNRKLKNELKLLRQSRDLSSPMDAGACGSREAEEFPGRLDPAPGGRYLQDRVIVNFAKMLTASFDTRKLFDHFIDSVMEIARVSRMSVMLKEKGMFRVKTHYGLAPNIAGSLMLGKDSALVSWLIRTGRVMQRPVNFPDPVSVGIKKDMDQLQCSLSFPMIYKGKLIGMFNIDNKIMGEPFYREEVEMIYVLCNYLAAAVKDIDMYHQIRYQKKFTKNIIASMGSGMIAIDRDEKITVFNQQASEILGLDASKMIGSDLRALPSPLGDILYETMVTDTSYKRHETAINPSRLPLGINSYRLLDKQQNPIGAGILFSDLSDSKKLEEQLRTSEKLKAVNELMAKIAHEIRNPLTSIHTYTQLINEKYADDDLNSFYLTTVNESIKRLDGLIDKLVDFSTTQEYNLRDEEVNSLLYEVEKLVVKNIPETHKLSKQLTERPVRIRADRKHLVNAVNYIMQHIINRTPEGTSIKIGAGLAGQDASSVEISITYTGDEPPAEEGSSLLKPLIDIENLGTELNMPISNKIIEGHNGALDIKSIEGINTFIISLPVLAGKPADVPYEGGRISGQ